MLTALILWVGAGLVIIKRMLTLTESYKPCPYCGEQVKETAKKCNYCGANLAARALPSKQ